MKGYEKVTDYRLSNNLPTIVRLDGRSFSKFTKDMERPFDSNFNKAMVEVTKYLVDQTHAIIGYTQSDEITLILYTDNPKGSVLFNNRVQKLSSNLAAMSSVRFLLEMQKYFPEKVTEGKTLPTFDARVFQVPSKQEAVNNVLWRCQDATKNSISMLAQCNFSHKQLHKLNSKELQYKLITEKGINWDNLPSSQKQGTFIKKVLMEKTLTEDVISKIPIDKRPVNKLVVRSVIKELVVPNFNKVKNKVGVVFEGETPKL